MTKSDFKFHTPVRVRWMECNAQRIVFNGAYMGYLEVGQSEYFRNLGFSIYLVGRRGFFDTAVVKTVLEFKSPARVDNMLDLYVRLGEFGNTSFHLEMEIYKQQSDILLTVIHGVYVGYDADTGETRRVPDEIRNLVGHFEATGEALPLNRFPALAEASGLQSQTRPH